MSLQSKIRLYNRFLIDWLAIIFTIDFAIDYRFYKTYSIDCPFYNRFFNRLAILQSIFNRIVDFTIDWKLINLCITRQARTWSTIILPLPESLYGLKIGIFCLYKWADEVRWVISLAQVLWTKYTRTIPTLFPSLLLICYPYISVCLAIVCITRVVIQT